MAIASTDRQALTLCASLVQNPMNLGALCRTAEVFRLRSLVLPSLAVVNTPEFRRLAVSAHQWQPLCAWAPNELQAWIAQQQEQQVAVVALTRHERAVPLPQYAFAARTALLLGRELTGIPTSLAHQCDAIVEIPQFGKVDSLNVNTAAAIAVYAYTNQHAAQRASSR